MSFEKPQILAAARQVCHVMTSNQTCGVAISGAVLFTFNMITFDVVSQSFSVLTGEECTDLWCLFNSATVPNSLAQPWRRMVQERRRYHLPAPYAGHASR